jgi:hypothetical protein
LICSSDLTFERATEFERSRGTRERRAAEGLTCGGRVRADRI